MCNVSTKFFFFKKNDQKENKIKRMIQKFLNNPLIYFTHNDFFKWYDQYSMILRRKFEKNDNFINFIIESNIR